MSSPGAKSLRGWFRCTVRFARNYCLALLAAALLLLGTRLLWPDAALWRTWVADRPLAESPAP